MEELRALFMPRPVPFVVGCGIVPISFKLTWWACQGRLIILVQIDFRFPALADKTQCLIPANISCSANFRVETK